MKKVGVNANSFSRLQLSAFIIAFAFIGGFFILKGHAAGSAATWYVSKNGSNAGGTSWAAAWNELNQINWSLVNPGDTILIDGGSTACTSNYDFSNHATNRPGLNCGMLYSTGLNITKSGSSGSPISIKLATDSGRNGTAVFFGGRTNALPYCTQSSYSAGGTARSNVVNINANYITLDGVHRSGFMAYGGQEGVQFASSGTSFINLYNMEIFDNGTFSTGAPGGGYKTDQKGIALNGHDITIDRDLIHDNGQDEIQDDGDGPLGNITISNSWIYSHRDHPTWTAYPFSSGAEDATHDCTHVDGIQIWGGGPDQQNMTIRDSIFGPLLGQGIYPGDQGNTSFDNVTISNILAINPSLHPFEGDPYSASTPNNWHISNFTSYLTNGVISSPGGTEPSHGNEAEGTGNSLVNSLFFGNSYFITNSTFTGTKSGNIYSASADPVPGGKQATSMTVASPPAGANNPTYSQLVAGDYTPTCTVNGISGNACSGLGSSIHTVQDLLNNIDTLNGGGGPVPGDVNGDGHVTVIDLSILLSHYGQSGQTLSTGDCNGDGSVTILDLSILLSNYGL